MASPPIVGVAGCGAMGLPMAERLLAAGFEVWGFDVRPVSEFGAFAERMIEEAAEFSERIDCVISVVRDVRQTLDLCFDDQAIFAEPSPPRTLVIASTLSPRALPEIIERLPPGIRVVDAPMSGAPFRARKGSLTFMVGGDDAPVRDLMPLFEAMGERIHHLGAGGAGMTCKVVNNFVGAAGVVAVDGFEAGPFETAVLEGIRTLEPIEE